MNYELVRYGIPFIAIKWDQWCTLTDKLRLRFNVGQPNITGGILDSDGITTEFDQFTNYITHDQDKLNIDKSCFCGEDSFIIHFDYIIPGTNNILSITMHRPSLYFISIRFISKERNSTWDIMKEILSYIHD